MPASVENTLIERKLRTMEQPQDDLRANAGDALSPAWHGDELARREAAVQCGDEAAEDWAVVRRRIRDATR